MTVEAAVIDFSVAATPEERYPQELDVINANRPQKRLWDPNGWTSKSGTKYSFDANGKLRVIVPDPTPGVERRVKRVLASCKRNPEFPYRPHLFFRNERVRDVPYPVLKRIYHESEGLSA
ncbi:hypothetical protein [Mycobacteroides abscessus]|uniref:hypothetical protein n=1 Tax=Mycobacteroides abscessus TaxID=36809 RepID=UPI000C259D9C|nr:hypothetical protein [Mycobacteroides abscessus]